MDGDQESSRRSQANCLIWNQFAGRFGGPRALPVVARGSRK
jgi:hypothetical protein